MWLSLSKVNSGYTVVSAVNQSSIMCYVKGFYRGLVYVKITDLIYVTGSEKLDICGTFVGRDDKIPSYSVYMYR